MDKNKRILFLDYARIFTAFLVVYGHLYPPGSGVRLYIYALISVGVSVGYGCMHCTPPSCDENLSRIVGKEKMRKSKDSSLFNFYKSTLANVDSMMYFCTIKRGS